MNVITGSSPRRSIHREVLFVGAALALFIGLGSAVAVGPSSRSVPTHAQTCQLVTAAGPYDLSDVPAVVAQNRVGRSRFEPGSDVCSTTVASSTSGVPPKEQSGGGSYDLSDVPDATTGKQTGRSRFQPVPDSGSRNNAQAAWWVMTTDATPSGPYDLSDVPDAAVAGTVGHSPFQQAPNAP